MSLLPGISEFLVLPRKMQATLNLPALSSSLLPRCIAAQRMERRLDSAEYACVDGANVVVAIYFEKEVVKPELQMDGTGHFLLPFSALIDANNRR